MGLAMLLIPMIPGLVQGVISIVDAIKGHPDTPEKVKAQLDGISLDLKAISAKVEAVQLPS